MARTQSVSDATLLRRARPAILEHGTSITSAMLAEATGVSEGTLYKRFGTKKNLLIRAVVNPDLFDWEELFEGIPNGNTLEVLEYLLDGFFDRLQDIVPGLMVLRLGGIDPPEIFAQFEVPPTLLVIGKLAEFFEHAQQRGLVDDTAPLLAARMVFAVAHSYAFGVMVGFMPNTPEMRAQIARDSARVIAYGVAPEDQRP